MSIDSAPTVLARTEGYSSRPLPTQIAGILFLLAILVLWALSWAGYFCSNVVFDTGPGAALEELEGAQALEIQVNRFLGWGVVLTLGAASVIGMLNLPHPRQLLPLILILLWVPLYVIWAPEPSISQYFFPLVVVAWVYARPRPEHLYRLIAGIGIATAMLSLYVAFAAGITWGVPELGFMPERWTENADKAMIGDQILRGIYAHSNGLALAILLPLPFVILKLPRLVALPAAAIMFGALLWTASRISLVIAVALIVFLLCLPLLRPRLARYFALAVVIVASLIMLFVPFAPVERKFLSGRGAIWQEGTSFFERHFWLGGGPQTFDPDGALIEAIGFRAAHGHNVFLTIAVSGGAISLLLLVFAVGVGTMKAFHDYEVDPMPLIFLVTFFLTGIAEDTTTAFDGGSAAWFVFPLLALTLGQYERNEFSWGRWRYKPRHSYRRRLRREAF